MLPEARLQVGAHTEPVRIYQKRFLGHAACLTKAT